MLNNSSREIIFDRFLELSFDKNNVILLPITR